MPVPIGQFYQKWRSDFLSRPDANRSRILEDAGAKMALAEQAVKYLKPRMHGHAYTGEEFRKVLCEYLGIQEGNYDEINRRLGIGGNIYMTLLPAGLDHLYQNGHDYWCLKEDLRAEDQEKLMKVLWEPEVRK